MQMFTQANGLYSMDEAQEAHWKRFGNFLREAMNEQGLTATECAKRAGMTLTQWSRLLNGASGTRRTTIPQIVRALGWVKPERIEDLYRRAGFVPPPVEDRSASRRPGPASSPEEAGETRETRETREPDLDEQERRLKLIKFATGAPPEDIDALLRRVKELEKKYGGRDPRDEED